MRVKAPTSVSMNAIELTQELIKCPSVTPADAGALPLLAAFLEEAGFTCHMLPFGEINNLYATIGAGAPHIMYAGHTDVVPTGPADKWTHGPFDAVIDDGILYGRGASDMKSSVAAFAVAAAEYVKNNGTDNGTISLLITGDEEAQAIDGTIKVLGWMGEQGIQPDVCLVGEPSNADEVGEEIRIGRRGSLTGFLTVSGKQGHVAYPHRADNSMPRLVKMLSALDGLHIDDGTEFFPASNLEIASINVDNTADNVIPAGGRATFNIRFNDLWTSDTLKEKIIETLDSVDAPYEITFRVGAESFLTQPGDWSALVQTVVAEETGRTPELTTRGGTSDARFIHTVCPVLEFGVLNQTIHQIDEQVAVSDIELITKIYGKIIARYFEQNA